MSVSETIEMKCPRCGAHHTATVWKSVDVASDPGIREALFSWEINVFNCRECDFRAQLPISLLYIDRDKRFAVQYYPMDSLGSEEFYTNFHKDGEPVEGTESAADPDAPKPHVVFDMAEMMRYIAFREIAFEKGR